MAKKAKKSAASVEARLAALEEQVESLLKLATDRQEPAEGSVGRRDQERFWAIENLRQRFPDEGGVAFAGHVQLPTEETYAWQIEAASGDLYEADWSAAQAPLAALAHPVRLALLKAILHGKRDTQQLQSLPEMGTTGQLYHHLKELESAGWIRQPRRGRYELLAERVVPLLAILAACEVTDKRPQ